MKRLHRRALLAGLLPMTLLPLALLSFTGAAWGANHTVTIVGMAFKPAQLTVKSGDTITWVNQDVVPHTATAQGVFDSKLIAPGARWSWQASGQGAHDYHCTFHPDMKATVVVR